MSAILNKVICSAIMSIMGVFVVKKISGSNENIFRFKSIILMLCLIVLPAVIYDLNYSYVFSIIIYCMTMIVYKYVLNISYIQSTLSCGVMMVLTAILDFISMCILVCFTSLNIIRGTWYFNIIANIIFSIILLILCYKTKLGDILKEIIDKISVKKQTKIVFFFALLVIAMSIILYISTMNFQIYSMFTTNFSLFLVFFLLVLILFIEKNNYDKLENEYDTLFEYIKVFEDWIENEKFIRHEYKNQLAVLRAMTKEKKVKEKIDNINSDIIDINNDIIDELKSIPNGGLKGLFYYKIIIARKKKLKIGIDVSNNVNKKFKKLGIHQIEIISKLIGVYLDNAIEAALETQKKQIYIEIYSYDNIIKIVISNSCNSDKLVYNFHEKGISTKGEGRGNGLYFAKKILLKNKWINEKQIIKDDYYIEEIKLKI